jgi:hypothetical protein
MQPGRNDPCPCGSGKKYKKCHLAQDEAEARASRPRVVERGDDNFLVSGNASDETLDLADEYFARRDAGRGPAQQMMEFVQPLIEMGDGSTEAINKAMTVGMMSWNLAVTPSEQREAALAKMLTAFDTADEETRSTFAELARMMIARHQEMFPELHFKR